MKIRSIAMLSVVLTLGALTVLPGWTQQSAKEPTPAPLSVLPIVFDLRDMDGTTPIKQQLGGTCWAHGTMAAVESNLILSGYWKGTRNGGLPTLSEYHLDWWNGFNKHCNDDLKDPASDTTGLRVHMGGDYRVASAYFSRGEGIVVLPSGNNVFSDAAWHAKAPPRLDGAYQRLYVRDVEWFTIGDNLEGIDRIKRRIMTEGAVATCYMAGRTYLARDNVHYQPLKAPGDPNHAVAIIGWDDHKISTDPDRKAPKPGAWLIKNSWGTRRGEQGYYWISYYDRHCCRHPEMGAVSFRNVEPMVYSNVYYHDYHGWRDTMSNVSKAFNSYTATGRQLIRAVSFFTAKDNVRYNVKLYRWYEKGVLHGELATKTGEIATTGFHTINLDAPVLLKNQDSFHVYVELSDGGHAIDRTSIIPVLLEQDQPKPQPKPQPRQSGPTWVTSKSGPNESFYHDGNAWKDLHDHQFAEARFNKSANFCIKALAVSIEESPYAKVPAVINNVAARNIGPANMGGRICDLAVVESNPKIMYVGAATGGVWKTTDGGDSWSPMFDQQTTLGIGAVAVCQSKPDIVWVGTGEANPRNSATWGDGVYRSIDGGKTWTNVGLRETRHIGRIVIHPKNPDIVYVAALGHLWGANKDRGLYMTQNSGKTWTKVKHIDDDTGFIDVAIDPDEPTILYAAAYCVRRDGYSGGNPKTQLGPGAGLYRSDDGGKTWDKMTTGLPTGRYGRCGLSIYRKDSKIVYAVVQTEKTPVTTSGAAAKPGDNVETGGIFRSEDKGKTWKKLNDLCPRPFYYGQIRVDPTDDQRIYVLGVGFHISSDGGKNFTTLQGRGGVHPDHHALWINPNDSNQVVLGNDGGLYFSKDRTKTFEAIRGMAIGQFYAVAVDMRKPYRVYGGLQDNGSWGGPSATASTEGISLANWRRVYGGDGFYCAIDPTDPDTVYAEMQYGGLVRVNMKATGTGGTPASRRIKPAPAQGEPAYRFNWNSPLLLSTHNPKTLYYGGNHLFKSVNQGDKWERISDDLTRGQPGPSSYSGHTLTTIAESPLKPGILWTGSDDGRINVSKDDGKTWTDVSEKVPDLPQERWITRVECSPFEEGTAYLAIARYRNDDLKPYLFKTTDFGQTWTKLMNNLPDDAPVHVVHASSKNKDLLFVGTENGLFASLDGGKKWHPMKNGLPQAVPVNDVVIHPRDRELVIGTHGRSVYVMNIAPLEELNVKVLSGDVHLCEIKPVSATPPKAPETPTTSKAYRAPNPDFGATISYYLRNAVTDPVTVTITNADGKKVATLEGAPRPGLHHVLWDLKQIGGNGTLAEPGDYFATLKVGDQALTKKIRIEKGE